MIKGFVLVFLLVLGFYGDLFLAHPTSFGWSHLSGMEVEIFQQIRLPRALVSFFAGASMALSGQLIQSSTRNPLSSPSILGINASASFFVCAYLVMDKLAKGISLLGASFFGSFLGACLLFLMGHFVEAKKRSP